MNTAPISSDAKVESIDYSENTVDVAQLPPDEEARLRRIFDVNLLPPLAFMYLCNALDKGNVGNAKTDGWDKDIKLTGNQASVQLYCQSLFTGIAKNFSEVFAIRFFLGIFESAMLPGVVFYLSTFYKRNELASRVGLFYAASSISGAFSGLIAYGVFHIKNPRHHAWQYLFWIEGAGTVSFAILALLWLPKSPSTWNRLTPRQKALAKARILADSSVVSDEKLNIRDAFRPFVDPMYWVWALISLSFGVPLASVNNFLPQIVASLGYSTVRTNLLTVAPNIVGTVALLLLTFSSDHFRERSIHIAWYSNNTPNESRRAVVAAVMVAIANSSGLISTNVFRAKDEPKYIPAAFGGLCLILVASTGIYMRIENRRRNKVQGVEITAADVDTELLAQGPSSPSFRYMY
ncbi:MFS general substrate transporter [Pholiota molesta]|nr:MFS general substrate transporter [Pholiota molesta]